MRQLLLRARFEGTASFQELAESLGYPTSHTARRAFLDAKARFLTRMQVQPFD